MNKTQRNIFKWLQNSFTQGKNNYSCFPNYFFVSVKLEYITYFFRNVPILRSNMSSSSAYGVFISQFIRNAGDCSSCECFILRAARLSNKLLKPGCAKERSKPSLRMFYGRYDLIKQYEVPPLQSVTIHDIQEDAYLQWHSQFIRHDMPTDDAYSFGHLVLSHVGTCMDSNVGWSTSQTCLVFGLSSIPLWVILWQL